MATLMAVHAHPDDEGIQTGGVLAMYRAQGVTTVLVTCTNGDMGDSPDGLKPEAAGHDTVATVETRLRELRASVEVLGLSHLELLGYRDSGMMGWPQNDAPDCFWRIPLEVAADRIAELFERYRPDVVITYDANGLYGHPDHIQAHRATMLAAERTGIPRKVYEIAFPLSLVRVWEEQRQQLAAARAAEAGEGAIGAEGAGPGAAPEATAAPDGVAPPEGTAPAEGTAPSRAAAEAPPPFGTPDEEITTVVDVSAFWPQKLASMRAHASQMANFDFLQVDPDLLVGAFGLEQFVRRLDHTGAALPESDLFAGIDRG